MMKIDKFFWLIIWSLCLAGCSESLVMDHPVTKDDKLEVLDIQFDENYKTFHVDVKVKDDFVPEKLIPMAELRIEGKELRLDMKEVLDKVQPRFLGAENIKSKKIAEAGLKVLILVSQKTSSLARISYPRNVSGCSVVMAGHTISASADSIML